MISFYPLGSECYISEGLKYSKLSNMTIKHSPFNGTVCISKNNINPIIEFLSKQDEFIDKFINKYIWKYSDNIVNGEVKNNQLNIGKGHLPKNDTFLFIKQSIDSIRLFNKNRDRTYICIDLNSYLVCYGIEYVKNMISVIRKLHNKSLFFIRIDDFSSTLQIQQKLYKLKNPFNISIERIKNIFNGYNIFFIENTKMNDFDQVKSYVMFFNLFFDSIKYGKMSKFLIKYNNQ